MKIKELMDKFGVGRETIRYYREKGLLHPVQNENGYFEYSEDDLSLLFQLLKYKYLNNDTFQGIDEFTRDNQITFDTLKEDSQRKIEELREQISRLEHLKAAHEYRVNYYDTITNDMYSIQHIKNSVGLYYIPFSQINSENEIRLMKNIRSYQSLVISPEEVISAKQSHVLHPEYCIGITTKNLAAEAELHSCSLKRFKHVPQGLDALRYVVKLEQLDTIPYETLKPVFDYIEEHQLSLAAPVTSIILQVTTHPKKAYYTLFRFVVK